jgi:hypothetical protein
MSESILYLNNYQLNEMFIGSCIFTILIVIYQMVFGSISILDIIYCGIAFSITYYISNLSFNFVIRYM